MTREILEKLEEAFRFTYTDHEASLYAGIDPATLYNYQNRHPEFINRKNLLRHTPNLHAKKTLVENIPNNLDQSRWWAKNAPTMRDEFGEVQRINMDGEDMNPEEDALIEEYEKRDLELTQKRIKEKAQKNENQH